MFRKKILKILTASLTLAFVFFYGCYYDSKENLYPTLPTVCKDTANVSYAGRIVPLFNSYCISCHNSSNSNGNVNLDNYQSVLIVVNSGTLINSIKHTGSASPMPKGGGKLDDCEIMAFTTWMKEGMLNN